MFTSKNFILTLYAWPMARVCVCVCDLHHIMLLLVLVHTFNMVLQPCRAGKALWTSIHFTSAKSWSDESVFSEGNDKWIKRKMETGRLTGMVSSHCGSGCAWWAGSGCKNFYHSCHMQKVSNKENQKTKMYQRKLSEICFFFFTSGFAPYQASVFAVMSFQLPWLGKQSLAVGESAHKAFTRIFETFSHFIYNKIYLFVCSFDFGGSQVPERPRTFFFFSSYFITHGLYHYHMRWGYDNIKRLLAKRINLDM